MTTKNKEMLRYVEYTGGNTKTSKLLGCSPDMVRKMKNNIRGIQPHYVRVMYRTKGFRLSFLRLFDLD